MIFFANVFIHEFANFVDAFTEKGITSEQSTTSIAIHNEDVASQGPTFFCLACLLDNWLGNAFFEIIFAIVRQAMSTQDGASFSHVQIVWSICTPICKVSTPLCLNLGVECVGHCSCHKFLLWTQFQGGAR